MRFPSSPRNRANRLFHGQVEHAPRLDETAAAVVRRTARAFCNAGISDDAARFVVGPARSSFASIVRSARRPPRKSASRSSCHSVGGPAATRVPCSPSGARNVAMHPSVRADRGRRLSSSTARSSIGCPFRCSRRVWPAVRCFAPAGTPAVPEVRNRPGAGLPLLYLRRKTGGGPTFSREEGA